MRGFALNQKSLPGIKFGAGREKYIETILRSEKQKDVTTLGGYEDLLSPRLNRAVFLLLPQPTSFLFRLYLLQLPRNYLTIMT